MILGYYLVVASILLLAGPVLLWIKKCRAGISQKLGIIPPSIRAALAQHGDAGATRGSYDQHMDGTAIVQRVWFHAVSVGEFNAVYPLVLEFRERHPAIQICVSTTTATGQEQAKKKVGDFATVFYFPFDLPFAVKPWLDLIRPEMVFIVETEIWPGFLHECRKLRVPVVLINGRLSPRSFAGYMRWRWFFKDVLKNFAALAVQSEGEAKRYAALSGTTKGITVCGNIKIDGIKPVQSGQIAQLRNELGLTFDDVVLVAGSTHEGEETALLNCPAVKENRVKLILVPRHPERFARVSAQIESAGFRVRRFSRTEAFEKDGDVYLLDTIGQLGRFYGVASLAFVGGTLVPIGGHSLAEPCAYSCPVLCGSHVHKTRDIATSMLEQEALVQVQSVHDLHSVIAELSLSPGRRAEIGEKGNTWLQENQGAMERTLQFIDSLLESPLRKPDTKVLIGEINR